MLSKRELRSEQRAKRKALSPSAHRAASAQIVSHLQALEIWKRSRVIGAFYPLPYEVDLRPLLTSILAEGAVLALPVVVARHQPLAFKRVTALDRLVPGAFGVREPPEGSPAVPAADLSLVVMPCLAIDDDERRLGYGGGYYDRTLQAAPEVWRVAVVFAAQRLTRLPSEPHDLSVFA